MNQQQINVSLDQTTPINCDNCKGQVFSEAFLLRKISRLLTGSAQDGVVPVAVMACISCGHINEQFLPVQLKKNGPITDIEFEEVKPEASLIVPTE